MPAVTRSQSKSKCLPLVAMSDVRKKRFYRVSANKTRFSYFKLDDTLQVGQTYKKKDIQLGASPLECLSLRQKGTRLLRVKPVGPVKTDGDSFKANELTVLNEEQIDDRLTGDYKERYFFQGVDVNSKQEMENSIWKYHGDPKEFYDKQYRNLVAREAVDVFNKNGGGSMLEKVNSIASALENRYK